MATTAISKIGVILTVNGKNITLFEDDSVSGLQFQVQGGKPVTLDGKIRVIVATTKANSTTPDVCPPEPYVHRYVTPTSIVLDHSDEHDAKLIKIDINNILAIDKVNDVFATPEYDLNGEVYYTLEEALAAAQPGDVIVMNRNTDLVSSLPSDVTAQIADGYVLTIPPANAMDVLNSGFGSIEIPSGSALNLNGENIIGVDGRIQIGSGVVTFDIAGKKLSAPTGTVTTIPEGKTMFLLLDYKNGTRETLDAVIEAGSKMTVDGTLKVPALTDGAELVVNGELEIPTNGVLQVSSLAKVTGTGVINNNGIVTLTKGASGEASLSAQIVLGMGGVVYSQLTTDVTDRIVNGKKETGSFEVTINGQKLVYNTKYVYAY